MKLALVLALAVAAALAACGGTPDRAASCRAGFDQGTLRADGVFLAVATSGCAADAAAACTISDGAGPIATEVVPHGIRQDCVAFNQYIGAALNAIPGYLTGECFAKARTQDGTFLPRGRCGTARADAPEFTYDRGTPAPGTTVIEHRVPDAYGRPPGVPRASKDRDHPTPPPWAVVTWRTTDGRVCHEGGSYVDDDTPGRGDQIPGDKVDGGTFAEPLVGSLRPDAHSGTGIQFYDVGRFLGYPLAEGGSCGDPESGPGLLVSLEHRHERRDLGPDRTVVTGIAGRRVVRVEVGGKPVELGRERRSFIALYDGIVFPDVDVYYEDGTRTGFGTQPGSLSERPRIRALQ